MPTGGKAVRFECITARVFIPSALYSTFKDIPL